MKTEKEKMCSGAYYTYIDAELDAERDIAEDLVTDYNRLHPKKEVERAAIIRKLFGSTGEIREFSMVGQNNAVGLLQFLQHIN